MILKTVPFLKDIILLLGEIELTYKTVQYKKYKTIGKKCVSAWKAWSGKI